MISSPLRYPGGKAKLYPFFCELISRNRLFDIKYCEPYAGGAGLALQLLCNGFVKEISINDIDDSIYAFWMSALRDTDAFCELIDKTPITIKEWHQQREIWNQCDASDKLSLGFSAYFLNRTNRSGIIDGAGPIGGLSQNGNWKIDARLVKKKQIQNLKAIARFSSQIQISNDDALTYMGRHLADKNVLTYLDPPYFVKGKKLYKNFYEHRDHLQIARLLKKHRKSKWVVSYDDVPQIRDAYTAFSPLTYLLNYSVGAKSVGKEVMYVSDPLIAPQMHGFKSAA